MKRITLYISGFLHFTLCTLSKADVVSRHYTVDPSLDNKVSNNSLVTKHHSDSLIECGIECGELCTFFGFNLQLKKCHIHQSCDSSELTATEAGWRYFKPDDEMAVDCRELHKKGYTKSGVYEINPTGKLNETISVYCDMETSGGGWTAHGGCDRSAEDAYSSMAPGPAFAFVEGPCCPTLEFVIQKREDGSTDFYRDWADYKGGFGDPYKNYWIGNDAIHALTENNQELRVHLESFDNQTAYAMYSSFKISNESSQYRLTVGGYTGTAGDSLAYSNENEFSTRDQDNDENSTIHCAQYRHGAWWYKNCATSNLNGQYAGSALNGHQYPVWYSWKSKIALRVTKMMIRSTC